MSSDKCEILNFLSSFCVGLKGFLQNLQFILTNLCAKIPVTAELIRKGSQPISIRRVRALAESLVCIVDRTKCPVSEA